MLSSIPGTLNRFAFGVPVDSSFVAVSNSSFASLYYLVVEEELVEEELVVELFEVV